MPEAFRVWRFRCKTHKGMMFFEKVREMETEELVPKAKCDLTQTRVSRDHPKPAPPFICVPRALSGP